MNWAHLIVVVFAYSLNVFPQIGSIPITIVGSLPSGRSGTVVLYNGNGKFYVIGGALNNTSDYTNEVLIYNYDKNTNELLTRFPPPARGENIAGGFGFVQKTNNLNITIHYIGGIYQYFNSHYNSRDIWTLNHDLYDLSVKHAYSFGFGHRLIHSAAFWEPELNCAYIIDSKSWKYFPENSTLIEIGQTGLEITTTSVYVGNDTVYIFGGGAYDFDDRIWRYDLKSGNLEILDVKLIYPIFGAGAAWNENDKMAYIVGGWTNDTNTPVTGVQQFNPETGEVTLLDVQLPHNLADIGVVWLKYFNELYVFGGSIFGGYNSADVMRVKLDDLKK